MTDHLVEIERKDWPILKYLYTLNDPEKYIAYTAIDNYIRLFEQDPNIKHVKFLCLNGDFSDGTFVVTDRCNAYADTFNTSFERLSKLLQLIDYTKGYTFLSIRSEIHLVILDALQKSNVEAQYDEATLLYHFPKENALEFNVRPSEGISLRPITTAHDIEKANSVWPHRNPNSFVFFDRMAKFNTNVGAYKDDGTLVAWLFRYPTGLLGALQTDEQYYGNGYGSLVVKYVSKKIAEMGHDIYAPIFEKNTASRSLFEKVGFKSIGEVHWIITKITWSPADD